MIVRTALTLLLLCFFSSKIEAKNLEKVRIHLDEIQTFENKPFLWNEADQKWNLVEYVSWDEGGCFAKVTEMKGPCGLHMQWCKACRGCGVLLCPMNCTCFD